MFYKNMKTGSLKGQFSNSKILHRHPKYRVPRVWFSPLKQNYRNFPWRKGALWDDTLSITSAHSASSSDCQDHPRRQIKHLQYLRSDLNPRAMLQCSLMPVKQWIPHSSLVCFWPSLPNSTSIDHCKALTWLSFVGKTGFFVLLCFLTRCVKMPGEWNLKSVHCGSGVKGATHCFAGRHRDGGKVWLWEWALAYLWTLQESGNQLEVPVQSQNSASPPRRGHRGAFSVISLRIHSRVVLMLSQFYSPHSGYLMSVTIKK